MKYIPALVVRFVWVLVPVLPYPTVRPLWVPVPVLAHPTVQPLLVPVPVPAALAVRVSVSVAPAVRPVRVLVQNVLLRVVAVKIENILVIC